MSKAVMSRAAPRALLPVAFLLAVLALAACSGGGQEPVGSASTLSTDAPATENTNTAEQPLPAEGDNQGISVASLPVGLSEDSPGNEVQCVRVIWAGAGFPSGVAAQVTSLDFRSVAYQQADSGCEGPSCTDYTYRSSGDACVVPVRSTRAGSAGQDTGKVTVSMEGRVVCADPSGDPSGDPCTSFADAADGPAASLTLTLPQAEPAPDDTGPGATSLPEVPSDSSGG